MPWLQNPIKLKDGLSHVMVDDRFAQVAPLEELGQLNWFGVWFKETPPEGALLHPDEEAAFAELERALVEMAERHANGWAVFCLRVLSYGIAEFYFYSRDAATLADVVDELRTAHPGYRIEHQSKPDESWAAYRKFLLAAK
ncbi:DUF695 domain-containing protein [Chitinimonas sp.]|uniref:DUF695 domain-containing protein n=1 Tax=Chitinimonas sp. TaxID=1934313 RepID=UPI002F93CD6C